MFFYQKMLFFLMLFFRISEPKFLYAKAPIIQIFRLSCINKKYQCAIKRLKNYLNSESMCLNWKVTKSSQVKVMTLTFFFGAESQSHDFDFFLYRKKSKSWLWLFFIGNKVKVMTLTWLDFVTCRASLHALIPESLTLKAQCANIGCNQFTLI